MSDQVPSKLLVVGLPRTGTTSLSRALLDLDYKVAHTAYSQASWQAATAVADTPAYSDFRELHTLWQPTAWLYLHRTKEQWLPSIRFLINQLAQQRQQYPDHLPPLFWRSWARVFGDFAHNISDQELWSCYRQHHQTVVQCANALSVPLYQIQLSDGEGSLCSQPHVRPDTLIQALTTKPTGQCRPVAIPHTLNQQRVTAWHNLKHPNKVSSHLRGPEGHKYYSY